MLGKEVKTLCSQELDPGNYKATWGSENKDNGPTSGGIYFANIVIGGKPAGTIKMAKGDGGAISNGSKIEANGSFSMPQKGASFYKTNNMLYTVRIKPNSNSNPQFYESETNINLSKDTLITILVSRYLTSPSIEQPDNVNLKEDGLQKDSAIFNAFKQIILYDKNGNPVPTKGNLDFSVNVQPYGAAFLSYDTATGDLKIDSLGQDKNGEVNVKLTAKSLANNAETSTNFRIEVEPMKDLHGRLTDDEGRGRKGYVLAINANRDSVITMTDDDGYFSLPQYNVTNSDTIRGHIINPNHNEAFIRRIIYKGTADNNNIVVDAVPSLPDSAYIGLDTLRRFAADANFAWGFYEGLKKANLDNLQDIISSYNTKTNQRITEEEQRYLKMVIENEIDSHFKKPSKKYIVPQDSSISSVDTNAVSWFKNNGGNPGLIGTWDLNRDGILEGSEIR